MSHEIGLRAPEFRPHPPRRFERHRRSAKERMFRVGAAVTPQQLQWIQPEPTLGFSLKPTKIIRRILTPPAPVRKAIATVAKFVPPVLPLALATGSVKGKDLPGIAKTYGIEAAAGLAILGGAAALPAVVGGVKTLLPVLVKGAGQLIQAPGGAAVPAPTPTTIPTEGGPVISLPSDQSALPPAVPATLPQVAGGGDVSAEAPTQPSEFPFGLLAVGAGVALLLFMGSRRK
jgi:hypothetical protein